MEHLGTVRIENYAKQKYLAKTNYRLNISFSDKYCKIIENIV